MSKQKQGINPYYYKSITFLFQSLVHGRGQVSAKIKLKIGRVPFFQISKGVEIEIKNALTLSQSLRLLVKLNSLKLQ